MTADFLVYVEHEHGQPKRTALEAVTAAARLAGELGGRVLAVALGPGAAAVADRLGRFGCSEVITNEADIFQQFVTEPHVEALAQVVRERNPQVVLLPDTGDGRDLGARLAARLDSGLVSSVVNLVVHDGHLDAEESIFGGNIVTTVEVKDSPVAVFLIRPNAFTPEERPAEVTRTTLEYTPSAQAQRVRVVETSKEEGAPLALEEASIIVSGGRGLGGPEPFALLEDLARELGGAVGASRAAVDAGWIPYSHQVGQTGRTVKPQLYIAVGISGAVQHRVGMQTADTIVAINKDADAPIFALSDLAVVGDLFAVIPALTDEVRKRKGA